MESTKKSRLGSALKNLTLLVVLASATLLTPKYSKIDQIIKSFKPGCEICRENFRIYGFSKITTFYRIPTDPNDLDSKPKYKCFINPLPP